MALYFRHPSRPQPRRLDQSMLISNQTHVSTSLATHLLSNNHHSNVVFSPLSIQSLLSLLAAGSKYQTLDQLLAFLKADTTDDLKSLYSQLVSSILADGSPTGGPKLSFANAVWVHKTLPLKPSFKLAMDTVYRAACKQVDFGKAVEVACEVNSWTKKETNGLIKEVITAKSISNKRCFLIFFLMPRWHLPNQSLSFSHLPLSQTHFFSLSSLLSPLSSLHSHNFSLSIFSHSSPQTSLHHLFSASLSLSSTSLSLSLKTPTNPPIGDALKKLGTWTQKFNTSLTKERDFHLLNGNKVKVPFMTNYENQFVHEYDDFKVLGLPYSRGQNKRKFTMYFYLSDAKDGLPSLINKIGSTSNFFDHHIPHKR
ncbi:putative Serpin family protein [Helianthus annuus]|nr:putative Serpin family protein [Helianthus annuus]KAJ0747353.1 putative Serpin family protein [Helianthus annuus]